MHQDIKPLGWTVSRPADEDRLTRRRSLVDTISLQVDIMSNSLPDKVSADRFAAHRSQWSSLWLLIDQLVVVMFWGKSLIRLCLSLCLQSQLAEEITFETLKKAIGENKEKFLRLLLASLLCGLSGASPWIQMTHNDLAFCLRRPSGRCFSDEEPSCWQ